MNREIKFRVVINNKIVAHEIIEDGIWKFTILQFNPDNFVRWTTGTLKYHGESTVIRHQYTVLKDINGK